MYVYTYLLFCFVLCWGLNSLGWQKIPAPHPNYPQRFTLGFDSEVWLPQEEPSKSWILASELSLVWTKGLAWLCSTWDYILSRMNVRISFSSKLKYRMDPATALISPTENASYAHFPHHNKQPRPSLKINQSKKILLSYPFGGHEGLHSDLTENYFTQVIFIKDWIIMKSAYFTLFSERTG